MLNSSKLLENYSSSSNNQNFVSLILSEFTLLILTRVSECNQIGIECQAEVCETQMPFQYQIFPKL